MTNKRKVILFFLGLLFLGLVFVGLSKKVQASEFSLPVTFGCHVGGATKDCERAILGDPYYQTYKVDYVNVQNDENPTPEVNICINETGTMGNGWCDTIQDSTTGPIYSRPAFVNFREDDFRIAHYTVIHIRVQGTIFNDNDFEGSFTIYNRLVEINSFFADQPQVSFGSPGFLSWSTEFSPDGYSIIQFTRPDGRSGGWGSLNGNESGWRTPQNLDQAGTWRFLLTSEGPGGLGRNSDVAGTTIEVAPAPTLPPAPTPSPTGTLRSDFSSCTKSSSNNCDVVLNYTTDNAATAKIVRNGIDWRFITSNVPAGTQVDSNPSPGNYDYILYGYTAGGGNETKLDSVKVTINPAPAPPGQYNLTVNRGGSNNGNGTVTSSPAGINCGSDCDESYVSGTSVTLDARPDGVSTFDYWEGDCSGTNPSCTLIMDANKSATAFFRGSAGPLPPGITCSLAFSPSSITNGESTIATWKTNDADGKVPYDCGSGNLASGILNGANGLVTVYPTSNQTCTLTVTNSSGTTGTCQGSVNVSSSSTPTPTPTLTSTPTPTPTPTPLPGTYSIGGVVFNDTNSNGTLNSGETGRPGVTVRLRDVNDTRDLAGPITSDSNGNYSYSGLPTGLYRIKIDIPSGCTSTSNSSARYDLPPSRTHNFGLSCAGPAISVPPPPPGSASDSCTVNVTSPIPTAANVSATEPNYCLSGPAATVSWVYSDPSGSPQSAYQVQVDDQSSFNTPEADSGKIFCSGCRAYSTPQGLLQFNKTYRARVRVWNQNDSASDWVVSPSWKTPSFAYPQVNFSFAPASPGQQQLITNDPIQFIDQTVFYDGKGDQSHSWLWLLGDGSSSTQKNPVKSYPNQGNYNVTLTATDSASQSCSISKPLNIQNPNPIWKEVNPGG